MMVAVLHVHNEEICSHPTSQAHRQPEARKSMAFKSESRLCPHDEHLFQLSHREMSLSVQI